MMGKARVSFSRCYRGPHLITLALIGVLSLVGCQDSSSRTGSSPAGDGSSTQKNSGDVLGDGTSQTTYYDHSESFVAESLEIRTLGKPVHMYWIVDTTEKASKSDIIYSSKGDPADLSNKDMADEIAAISTHLPPFIESLKKLSPVQVAMISNFSPEAHVLRPRADPPPYVDRGVMEAAGVHVLHSKEMFGYPGIMMSRAMGYFIAGVRDKNKHPSGDFFLDPKALKVIIMVRDRGLSVPYKSEEPFISVDHSRDVLRNLNKFSGNNLSSFRFFALIDLRDSYLNDLSRNRGAYFYSNHFYHRIVKELGGEKYHTNNISSSEWTKVFDSLNSKIAEEVGGSVEKKEKATFTLQRPASKVLEVKVAGKALAKANFQATGTTLYIDAQHVSEGQNIAVKYQSTRSS